MGFFWLMRLRSALFKSQIDLIQRASGKKGREFQLKTGKKVQGERQAETESRHLETRQIWLNTAFCVIVYQGDATAIASWPWRTPEMNHDGEKSTEIARVELACPTSLFQVWNSTRFAWLGSSMPCSTLCLASFILLIQCVQSNR